MCEVPSNNFAVFWVKNKLLRSQVSPWTSPQGGMAQNYSCRQNISGMREAVAVCLVLLCCGSLSASLEGTGGAITGTRHDFALADTDTQESLSFTLAGKSTPILPVIVAAIDHHHSLDGAAQASKVPEIAGFIIEKDAAAPISVSVFLGRSQRRPFLDASRAIRLADEVQIADPGCRHLSRHPDLQGAPHSTIRGSRPDKGASETVRPLREQRIVRI